MQQEELEVTNPKGIHARPSALIVDTAKKSGSTITLTYDGETVDATNIMDVLSLGVAHGARILVGADGGDEAGAIARMREVFALNFNDDPD